MPPQVETVRLEKQGIGSIGSTPGDADMDETKSGGDGVAPAGQRSKKVGSFLFGMFPRRKSVDMG